MKFELTSDTMYQNDLVIYKKLVYYMSPTTTAVLTVSCATLSMPPVMHYAQQQCLMAPPTECYWLSLQTNPVTSPFF